MKVLLFQYFLYNNYNKKSRLSIPSPRLKHTLHILAPTHFMAVNAVSMEWWSLIQLSIFFFFVIALLSCAALGGVERVRPIQRLHSPTIPDLSEKWPLSKSQTHLRSGRVTGWWICGVNTRNTQLAARSCLKPNNTVYHKNHVVHDDERVANKEREG